MTSAARSAGRTARPAFHCECRTACRWSATATSIAGGFFPNSTSNKSARSAAEADIAPRSKPRPPLQLPPPSQDLLHHSSQYD